MMRGHSTVLGEMRRELTEVRVGIQTIVGLLTRAEGDKKSDGNESEDS
jgi:hypothetical protein